MVMKKLSFILAMLVMLAACEQTPKQTQTETDPMEALLNKYVEVPLTADVSHLSSDEKEMLKLLFEAAAIMDDIFWMQNLGEKAAFLDAIENARAREFATINYGPWDELDNQKPFLEGFSEKPAGAQFYPLDMTVEEFEAFDNPDKTSLYTLIRRDENGALKTVWYHEAYANEISRAADLLDKAAELAGDKAFAVPSPY